MSLFDIRPPNLRDQNFAGPVWMAWFRDLRVMLDSISEWSWADINKDGSNLADLEIREHAGLQSVLGSGSYHVSQTQHGELIGGGTTALHYHASDRDRANHTGTQLLVTISDVTITASNLNALDDGANTTLHYHDADRARANHTGTQSLSTISDVTITAANLNALDDGADTSLHYHSADRSRANHTGTQALSTISDAGTAAAQSGLSVTVTLAKITALGSDGSLTFTAGVLTSKVDPT